MDGDAVEQLGPLRGGEALGALLDQPQPEVDVPEQPALVGRRERRPARELDRTPDIVDERRRQHELGAQARMELRRLAAERRDADRVLEQAAGVGVMVVGVAG